MQEKPYIDASAAAVLLGVDRRTVVADVRAGMAGTLSALIGGEYSGIVILPRWEVEGERLEMHKARLAK